MTRLSQEVDRLALDLAWSLWSELGVDGVVRRHDWQAIDLEPLIIFTARLIEAEEAARLGLLNEVVDDLSALERRAGELARLIASHAPLTLRSTKQALLRMQPKLREDEDLILMCYQSRDFREGMDAFLNKRQPQWTGE